MSDESQSPVDLSVLGSFDFTPDWAKGERKVTVGSFRPERGDRPPRGDRPERGDRSQPSGARKFERKGPRQDRGPRRQEFAERPQPLDAEVKVLPEPKALGTIFRKLQQDYHAYKLKDLAYFLLDNPESVLLKIVPKGEAAFCQCKACSFASMREEDVVEHAVRAHLGDYYDTKEIEVEPPAGNFSCVARCGLSGVLLGPPNIHEFNAVVREMVRTRYPEMSEEQYRSHIEMVRDPEVIEEWRKGAVKKTVFVPKGQSESDGAKTLSREAAELEFKTSVLPSMLSRPKSLMITLAAALSSPAKPIQWAARNAVEAERRAPYAMCFALRGAFHHRKMNFFRANDSRGQEFVTGIEHKEFDAAHAIPELAAAWKFVAENPCCDKSEFPAVADFEKHVQWLASTGHVVAFTNGVYSAVEKFPKYGPQWKKRANKPAPAPAPEAAPASEAASAPVPEPTPEPAPVPEAPAAPAVPEKDPAQNENPAQLA